MVFNEKFSVCITTYNRAKKLKRCLDSFINSAKKFNIPIYISDNHSTDNTEEMIEEYKKEYENIIYRKNSQNLGCDKNYIKVIEMAQTQYALLFGDDDALEPNAIETVLSELENNPDLCILNIFDNTRFQDTYTNPYEFFRDYGMPGLNGGMHLSTLVIKAEDWKKQFVDYYSSGGGNTIL